MFEKSEWLWTEANKCLIGGVNSPVRAFRAVGGSPVFIERANGARLYDVDGNGYCDYIGSWGPMILGHAHPDVIAAVRDALDKGTSFGASTEAELRVARLIVKLMPSVEMVRMVNSGTEATMTAIRLARGYTGRDMIIKFEGCYHGHVDSLLVKAGSGATTLGIPDSKGVPVSVASDTITLPFNDVAAVNETLERKGSEIAAVILEPVVGNMGVVPPLDGYLGELRELSKRFEVLLIFDEVMTGFRLSTGGAQQLYDVMPDITCLGKIIGGGMPVGAVGGKREIMEYLAPLGPVYQAGTLSGNPIAMAAGGKTLELIQAGGVYETLDRRAEVLAGGINEAARSASVDVQVQRVGSMLCPFFTSEPVTDYQSAKRSDTDKYARFFWSLLKQGVYVPPSQFEAHFLSLAHSEQDIEMTIDAMFTAMRASRG